MPGAPIWLAGLMGAGKTTIGTALAVALRRPFVDNDVELAARTGRPLREWSDLPGLHGAEREYVADIRRRPGAFVAALPASTADGARELEALRSAGLLVYLRAPAIVRARRIRGTDRPPEPRQARLRDVRYTAAAALVIDATQPVEDIVAQIAAAAASRG